jgi:hypothetical protein
MTERFDSKHVLFEWEDGLLIATYHPDVRKIDREVAEEIVRARLQFQGLIPKVALLIRARGSIQINKAAREYFSSAEGIKGLAATAIVTDANPVIRQLAEWFQAVQQPKMRLKLFGKEANAKAWLHGYSITHSNIA